MKILRFLTGILLLPFCVTATRVLISLAQATMPPAENAVSGPTWALAGGFIAWLLIFLTLPRPARSYVLAHELSHAIWGKMMGAKIFGIRISEKSGSVTLSKTNFLVILAPYFFPFYAVLVVISYYLAGIFVEVEKYYLVWLAFIGLTWGFHFTFTITTLLQHQSDIKECGALFSYVVIYIMNVLGICLGVVLVSSAGLEQMVGFLWGHSADTCRTIWRVGVQLLHQLAAMKSRN